MKKMTRGLGKILKAVKIEMPVTIWADEDRITLQGAPSAVVSFLQKLGKAPRRIQRRRRK